MLHISCPHFTIELTLQNVVSAAFGSLSAFEFNIDTDDFTTELQFTNVDILFDITEEITCWAAKLRECEHLRGDYRDVIELVMIFFGFISSDDFRF